eukprot:276791-Hanusia_phi.AAC.3
MRPVILDSDGDAGDASSKPGEGRREACNTVLLLLSSLLLEGTFRQQHQPLDNQEHVEHDQTCTR